jgi:hypothetical protein
MGCLNRLDAIKRLRPMGGSGITDFEIGQENGPQLERINAQASGNGIDQGDYYNINPKNLCFLERFYQ